jgi:predicted dehydrogenase
MKRLRISVVGAGRAGQEHLQRIVERVDLELVAIADPAASAAAVAARFEVPCHPSLDALLDGEVQDAVVIALPTSQQAAVALRCIEAGLPLLLEPPVADGLPDAQRVHDAAEREGIPMLVALPRRHDPVMLEARATITAGRLGRLVAVSGSAALNPSVAGPAGPSSARRRNSDNPLLGRLIHEIDGLRMLAGDIVEVHAMASSANSRLEVDETMVIGLRFASGALGTFLLSEVAGSPLNWEEAVNRPSRGAAAARDCLTVCGDRGSLGVPSLRLRRYEGPASWWEPMTTHQLSATPRDCRAAQLDHFCAVARGQEAPCVDLGEALRSLAATLAVAQAARTGRPMFVR